MVTIEIFRVHVAELLNKGLLSTLSPCRFAFCSFFCLQKRLDHQPMSCPQPVQCECGDPTVCDIIVTTRPESYTRRRYAIVTRRA
eukprot:1902927-Pyramimonas_sp.AAC.1